MSVPVTAAALIGELARHQHRARLDSLASLDDRERDVMRRVVSALRPNATIDIPGLVEDVRRLVAERDAGISPEEAADLRAHARAANAQWRDECERRGIAVPSAEAYAVDLAMQAATTTTTTADAEPDDELDDDAPEQPPKRRGVERRPLRRAGETPRLRRRAAPDPARAGKRARTSPAANGRPFLGGRCIGGPGDPDRPLGMPIDYDSSYEHFRPPWLLDPGTDDETEKDYVTASETRVGA